MRIFEESQKFDQWWFKAIIYGSILVGIGPILYQWIIRMRPAVRLDTMDDSNKELIITTVLISALLLGLWLFYQAMILKTKIDRTGVYVQFKPFHMREKYFSWDEISTCEVIQYNPLKDYGGWGVRFGRKGGAYNVKGNMGLHLILKNKKKLLIGTQKAEELEMFIDGLN